MKEMGRRKSGESEGKRDAGSGGKKDPLDDDNDMLYWQTNYWSPVTGSWKVASAGKAGAREQRVGNGSCTTRDTACTRHTEKREEGAAGEQECKHNDERRIVCWLTGRQT